MLLPPPPVSTTHYITNISATIVHHSAVQYILKNVRNMKCNSAKINEQKYNNIISCKIYEGGEQNLISWFNLVQAWQYGVNTLP